MLLLLRRVFLWCVLAVACARAPGPTAPPDAGVPIDVAPSDAGVSPARNPLLGSVQELPLPPDGDEKPSKLSKRMHVWIDAGHGAPGNAGTAIVNCGSEQDQTRMLQDATVAWLREHTPWRVTAGRPTAALLTYAERLRLLDQDPPHAVVSLHVDARAADGWAVDARGCMASRGGQGFAVLYSDEGPAGLAKKRQALADALARSLIAAGFRPYDGADYAGLYAATGTGVFVDRHSPRQRIMMLRKTRVPLVILETHQGLDPIEHEFFAQETTQRALASAIANAVMATQDRR